MSTTEQMLLDALKEIAARESFTGLPVLGLVTSGSKPKHTHAECIEIARDAIAKAEGAQP